MDALSKARLVFEAAEQLGWSNPAEVAEFAQRLEQGLPAEDELSVVFHWLGQCRLVHKLDQFPYPPGVWQLYRVPDLLAVFDVGGRHYPVLIEVKTSVDDALSWKPDYLSSLQRYASLLGLPLLVGWKYQTFWTLFEAKHFRKATTNLKVSFKDAMKQNLLGILAGDFSFCFRPGTSMHIRTRKLKETSDGFDGVIEEAYFSNADGRRHGGGGGVLQFFLCIDQEPVVVETDTDCFRASSSRRINRLSSPTGRWSPSSEPSRRRSRCFPGAKFWRRTNCHISRAAHDKRQRMPWMRDSSS